MFQRWTGRLAYTVMGRPLAVSTWTWGMGLYLVLGREGDGRGMGYIWGGGSQEVVSWGRQELTDWGTPLRGKQGWVGLVWAGGCNAEPS